MARKRKEAQGSIPEGIITIDEMADRLGYVGRDGVYAMIREGRLPSGKRIGARGQCWTEEEWEWILYFIDRWHPRKQDDEDTVQ